MLKKRLFCNSREIPSDPIEVSLLYAQGVHSVVKVRTPTCIPHTASSRCNKELLSVLQCDELPVSEKVALQLAGLQAQVSLGEPQPDRLDLYADVDFFLPGRIKRARFLSDAEWVPILAEAHLHYGAGKAEVVAKVWYLSCIMQYPLYGATLFPANYKGYWSHGSSVLLAVNCDGLLLVKPDDKSVLFEFPYPEIESLLLDPSDDFITLNLNHQQHQQQRVHVFETPQKEVIGALVAAYWPQLANWIREADAPRRRVRQVGLDIVSRALRRGDVYLTSSRSPTRTGCVCTIQWSVVVVR